MVSFHRLLSFGKINTRCGSLGFTGKFYAQLIPFRTQKLMPHSWALAFPSNPISCFPIHIDGNFEVTDRAVSFLLSRGTEKSVKQQLQQLPNRLVFTWVSKIIRIGFGLHYYAIRMAPKQFVPLSHPIRRKNKADINRDSLAQVFSRLASATKLSEILTNICQWRAD